MITRGLALFFLVLCAQGVQAAFYLAKSDSSSCYAHVAHDPDTLGLQDTIPEVVLARKAEDMFEKLFRYVPVPYLGFSTETSLTFGIIKYNAFKFHNRQIPDSLMQLSSVSLYGFYTLKNQYEIKLKGDLMFGPNRFNTVFEFSYRDFPTLYFGVGNDTREKDGMLTDFNSLLLKPGFNYNVYSTHYLGVVYTFNNFFKVELVDSSGEEPLLKENEGIQAGFGIKYFREGRDNRLRARKGSYMYVSYDLYTHIFGSQFDYGSFTVDLRKYYSPFPQLTVAGQLYAEIKTGDVPVQSLAVVGGKYRMRGIYRGRFRDKAMAMAQMEMRFPLYGIVGGAVFGGMGQVAPRPMDFKNSGFHYAGGGGLRIFMDRATSSVLRVDVGFSKEGNTLFFGFGEAF
ncbi:MAG: BamA/TamA family outer membrane protein, partial [Bacteroidales bacterium]|nr:BamA/TamA family outer membrane protein [Bacteroidales bacterium]